MLTDLFHLLIKSLGGVFHSFHTLGHKVTISQFVTTVAYSITVKLDLPNKNNLSKLPSFHDLFKILSKSPLKQPKYNCFKRCSKSKILPCVSRGLKYAHSPAFEHLPSGSSRDLITVFIISCIPIVMAFSNNNLS